jgi:hypothetical protein
MGQFCPWPRIDADGSLSPDSFRARRMLLTADSGQELTHALQQTSPERLTTSAMLSPA